ncbi:TPA: hypothetical protein ACIQN7_002717 [Bacillus cereus]
MFFEFQLSSQNFERIFRKRLKEIPFCVDREENIFGTICVIDRVEITDTTIVQKQLIPTQNVGIIFPPFYPNSFTVPYLQIKQEVNVQLVKSSDLELNGPNPSQPVSYTFELVFNVSMNIAVTSTTPLGSGGPVQISYQLEHINYQNLDEVLSSIQKENIKNWFSKYQLPPTTIDIAPFFKDVEFPITAINAGITCNSTGDFIVMRVEIRSKNGWLDGDMKPEFFTQDAVNLLNGGEWALLMDVNILKEEANEKIKNSLENVSKFKLRNGPSLLWNPSGPTLGINLGGELMDSCPFFVDNIDMDVEVDITMNFSVPEQNIMRTHYLIDPSPSNEVEKISCAVTATLLYPFTIAPILFESNFKAKISTYLFNLTKGPIRLFFAFLREISSKGLENDISTNLGDNCKKLNDENYECEENFNIALAGLSSRLNLQSIRGVPQGVVLGGNMVNQRDLPIEKITSVDVSPFEWLIEGKCRSGFSIVNKATVSVYGGLAIKICSARVMDDPLGEFILTQEDYQVTVRPKSNPDYVKNPYPCRIRIITTKGVRTITIPAPNVLTSQKEQELKKASIVAIASCKKWEKHFMPWEKVKWQVDPPYINITNYLQLWQIVIGNQNSKERIEVINQEGKTLLSAQPSMTGVSHLTLFFRGDEAQEELLLKLDSKNERHEPRNMTVHQALYVHRASIPSFSGIQYLSFEKKDGRHILVHTSHHEESRWDISTPMFPILQNVSIVNEENNLEMPIIHNGKHVSSSIKENTLNALEKIQPKFKKFHIIGNPKVGGVKETLYLGSEQGGTLFDISDSNEPLEIQKFFTKSWFEYTALSGKLLAIFNPEKEIIEIFEATSSHII